MLETDASGSTVAAIRSQEGHPVLFISRTLTEAEKNWSNIERDALTRLSCEAAEVAFFNQQIPFSATTLETELQQDAQVNRIYKLLCDMIRCGKWNKFPRALRGEKRIDKGTKLYIPQEYRQE